MDILIIEDEELASQQLIQFIQRYNSSINIVGKIRSVTEGILWFKKFKSPDLIFSDIELLDGNVFGIFDTVTITCPVIFTTAYDRFMLQAFRVNGIAYLLKPYDYGQFLETINKYHILKENFESTKADALSSDVLANLGQALNGMLKQFKQRFLVKIRNSISILDVKDIAYIQADEGVVFAIDRNGNKYPINGTLTEIEKQLDPSSFFRINRSDLISIDFIDRVEPYFNNRLAVKIKNSEILLIASAALTPEFRKWLNT